MKHGKRPTVKQCKFMKLWGLNYENWLVVKDTPREMIIMHRYGTDVKTLPKGVME